MPAYRASNQIQADGYAESKRLANSLKTYAQSIVTLCQANNCGGNDVKGIFLALINLITRFNAIAAIPGIAAYAQAQENDNTYDVVAAFNGLLSLVATARDWITTNIPQSSGYVLLEQWSSSGIAVRVFSNSDTTGLQTALNNVIASIT
jgi:hypothetical protein